MDRRTFVKGSAAVVGATTVASRVYAQAAAPDKIRFVVNGLTGPQVVEINGEGIAIFGTTIGLMARPARAGAITSLPPVIPGPPTPAMIPSTSRSVNSPAGRLSRARPPSVPKTFSISVIGRVAHEKSD